MLTIEAKALTRAIDSCVSITGRGPHYLPVLGALMVRASAGTALFSTTDADLQIDVKVGGNAVGQSQQAATETSVLIPKPWILARAVKTAKAESAEFQADDKNASVAIKAGEFQFHMETLPAVDWPEMKGSREVVFSATFADEAIRALRMVSAAASREQTRYYLNGVYLHEDAGRPWGYTLVATDGHRMHVHDIALPDVTGEMPSGGVIIPNATVKAILSRAKVASDTPARFELLKANSGLQPILQFSIGDTTLFSKLIDGTFPNYQRVVPKDTPISVTFRRDELRRAVSFMHAGRGLLDKTTAATLEVGADSARITSRWHHSAPGAETSVKCLCVGLRVDGSGRDHLARAGFNTAYLLAILDGMGDAETVRMLFDAAPAANPCLVTDPANPLFRAVLMPMRT